MAKERIRRLEEIQAILKQNGGKMPFSKLFGSLALKYGTTKTTFWDYLETLKNAGLITIEQSIDPSTWSGIGTDPVIALKNVGDDKD